MTYDVQLIARYVINRCAQTKRPISNLKLQKILYFVQAEFLVGTGQTCFDDDIEAWTYGPVVPAVYFEYKIFGSTNIPDQGKDGFEAILKIDKERLDAIIDEAAKYSALNLTEITHRQYPWKKARKRKDLLIKKSEIKDYFSR
jgi:uncharacterized phage-associated protein